MAWRGLHLTRGARLTLADQQLMITQEGASLRVPLEDIAWIVLDSPQVTVTTALIAACMEAGCVIVTTDARHMPSGLVLPFHQHHRQAHVAGLQLAATAPLKKRLWKNIVRAKIGAQAACLAAQGGDPAPLLAMEKLVRSGDPENVEARAAREYWRRLLPDFVREDGTDRRNMLLNYGYAVLRACIARALVASGFLPCMGLHHESAANAFNLADDLIEPFRPFVDARVCALSEGGRQREGDLTAADRQALATLPLQEARVGHERVSLLTASEICAESLARALASSSPTLLRLPSPA